MYSLILWTGKAKAIDLAICEIGCGYYQILLFFLCGSGWFVDNLYLQAISLVLPKFCEFFGILEEVTRYATVAFTVGLFTGAFNSSFLSDIYGRKIPFATNLFIGSIFGIGASFAKTWTQLCVLVSFAGIGIGGSLPCDAMMFMEFLPSNRSSLLVS